MVVGAAGLVVAAAVMARPAPAIPAARPVPAAAKVQSARAAVEAMIADPGGVIAFGELHQTRATAKVRSALARFTDEILPVVAPHASHLIVETWITRGTCGEAEAQVTKEVARTTERPVETESEIVKLLRRAKELGVAPHVLDVGCDEYKVLAGAGGTVDYDRLLTITNQHLERAIGQGLLLARAPGRPLVVVYGGALHNDLYPDPTLAKYTFGRHVHAATRGAYREVDLYVPEMVDTTPALKAEPWYPAWQHAGAGKGVVTIDRGGRSTIVVFRRGGLP
ncbi:MAG TPA: hypothetical protein VKQ32_00675 [Polyangia bacterium]|nr:hypothetical protein [Polyangia bacterium]